MQLIAPTTRLSTKRNRVYKREAVVARLMAKVYLAPSGCWEWLGVRHAKGYGCIHMNDGPRTQRAHRVSYEAFVGPIPDGLQIDHLCHNRGCVNPAHLQPVTPQMNQLRGMTAGKRYALRTHCGKGHEFTPENTSMKSGARRCKACHREEVRAYKARKRGAA